MTNINSKKTIFQPPRSYKKTLVFLVLLLLFVFAGCTSESETNVYESSDSAETSANEISQQSEESQNEQSEENESTISNEDVSKPSYEQILSSKVDDIKNKEKYTCLLSIHLNSPDVTSQINGEIIKNGNAYSLVFEHNLGNVVQSKEEYRFIDGVSYVCDNYLGKCMYECEYADFQDYIKDIYPIFRILNFYKDLEMPDDDTFEYTFSEEVLNENYIQNLISKSYTSKSYTEEMLFSEGICQVKTLDGEINKINFVVKLTSTTNATSLPIEIKFEISFAQDIKTVVPPKDEYKNFKSANEFNLSKSFYNLISHSTYEIEESTRIYIDFDKNSYHDINSSIVVSYLDRYPKFKEEKSLFGSTNYNFEKIISEKNEYVRSYASDGNIPEFTASEFTDELNEISVSNLWHTFDINILSFKEFSMQETDDYFIIDFVYSDDMANKMLTSYYATLIEDFPEAFSKDSKLKISKINEAKGKAIIRKKDLVLIEQAVEISATHSKTKTLKLFYSCEVIDLNHDVQHLFPNIK